ncbi:Uncharacterised protein [Vibrio cholerae]|nr:Uncharacterised protein [Vibrio cholerae]CSI75607.1 Uncharacterised protein [Vibrio cholerae]
MGVWPSHSHDHPAKHHLSLIQVALHTALGQRLSDP